MLIKRDIWDLILIKSCLKYQNSVLRAKKVKKRLNSYKNSFVNYYKESQQLVVFHIINLENIKKI